MPHRRSQAGDAAALGDDSRDRHQEVLGEQLAAGQRQRDEADRVGQAGEQWIVGLALDQQQRQHTAADVETAQQPGPELAEQRAAEPLLTLVDEPVEGLLLATLLHGGPCRGRHAFPIARPRTPGRDSPGVGRLDLLPGDPE